MSAHPGILDTGVAFEAPTFASVEAERAHRKGQLAVAYRLFAALGYDHWVAGHITVRDPGDPHRFWVNPFGRSWRFVRACDLLLVDLDGNLVEGEGAVNAAAFAIHSEIHRARPDVTAIAHAHTPAGRAWSATGRLLEPLSQDACAFYDDHALFDDFSGVVFDTEEGGAIARALGDRKALLLEHHGLLTVGETVDEAAFWLHLLERCCDAQLTLASLPPNADGSPPYRPLTPDVAAHTRAQVGEHVHGWMGFQPLCEEIVRADPDVLRSSATDHPERTAMSYRVVLWTTGHVASFAGRAIVDHPNMELVGAYAWSPEKAGRDVGELIGTEPLGIAATSDVDELLALRPDVVGYYPIMRTEAVPEHVDTICRFLEAGVNVVSTANLITGRWWDAEARFAEAGAKGNASLFASGVNPGFVNQLMLTATGVCSEVRKLSVWEEAECSGYDSPELWETVAFGHDPSEPDLEKYFHQGTAVFEDTVQMMAEALEVELDEIRYVPEVALADKDLDLGWMTIAAGHIAGLKNTWLGIADGAEVIELGTIWKMTDDVTPNWEIRHGWHVQIDGVPTVKLHFAGWPPEGNTDSELLMGLAMLMTAMPTVHAIPHVVAAKPGVVSYKDLPLVTAAHCVKTK